MKNIIGDISPDCKRHFAGPSTENRCNAKRTQKPGSVGFMGAAKLTDTVHELAANINRIMERLKAEKSPLSSNEKLAEKVGISSNTIGRMRRGDGSVGIINVSRVAKVFGMSAWELLYPGLDMSNRPEVVSDPNERALLDVHRRKPPPTQH